MLRRSTVTSLSLEAAVDLFLGLAFRLVALDFAWLPDFVDVFFGLPVLDELFLVVFALATCFSPFPGSRAAEGPIRGRQWC